MSCVDCLQADLDASLVEHAVPPVVAARPHFGNPEDAPARPSIFSGVLYKLPSSATSELPAFRSLAAPSAWDTLKSAVAPEEVRLT